MEAIPSLFILMVASIVVFGTAADWCSSDIVTSCTGRVGWAIAAGVISTIVTAIVIVLHKVSINVARRANVIVSIFLIIWWSFGVGYLTTGNGPYSNNLSNGYFATWIAFIASVFYGYLALAALRGITFTFGHGVALCLLASIVEFAVASRTCSNAGSCTGRWGWAVAVGVISTILCLIQLIMHYFVNEMAEKFAILTGAFLVVLWAFGAGFNTSADGPFPSPVLGDPNGYFFTWLALFSALYYAAHAIPGVREAFRTNSGHAEPAWVGHKARDVEATGGVAPGTTTTTGHAGGI